MKQSMQVTALTAQEAEQLVPNLSPTLREIAKIIGAYKAIRLMFSFQNLLTLYIPAKATNNHRIAQIIGVDNMNSLCAKYSGVQIELPRGKKILRQLRNINMRQARESGVTISELMCEYSLSRRMVMSIVNQKV